MAADIEVSDQRHAHGADRDIDGGVVLRPDHLVLRLDGLVLQVARGQPLADDLSRRGDPFRLDDAFVLLAFRDLDFGQLALQFLYCRQLLRYWILPTTTDRTSNGVLAVNSVIRRVIASPIGVILSLMSRPLCRCTSSRA